MNRQQEIDLGKQAEQVLQNPAYQRAWELYEQKIWEQFKTSTSMDLLQTLRRQQSSLTIVRRNLELLVAGGKEAAAKLDFETKQRSLADRLLRRA